MQPVYNPGGWTAIQPLSNPCPQPHGQRRACEITYAYDASRSKKLGDAYWGYEEEERKTDDDKPNGGTGTSGTGASNSGETLCTPRPQCGPPATPVPPPPSPPPPPPVPPPAILLLAPAPLPRSPPPMSPPPMPSLVLLTPWTPSLSLLQLQASGNRACARGVALSPPRKPPQVSQQWLSTSPTTSGRPPLLPQSPTLQYQPSVDAWRRRLAADAHGTPTAASVPADITVATEVVQEREGTGRLTRHACGWLLWPNVSDEPRLL